MKKFIRICLFLACAFAFSQSSWADQHGSKGKALGKGTEVCMQEAGDAKKDCLENQMRHRDEMKEGKDKKDKKDKHDDGDDDE